MPHRRHSAIAAGLAIAAVLALAACDYNVGPTAPTTDTSAGTTPPVTTTPSPTPTPSTITYVKDVQPVLSADCVRCHGPSRRESGVDLSTYSNVMRTVSPGNANSLLILVTRQGGRMYNELSGSRSQKSTLIRDWIVTYNAAQQ